MAAPATKKAPAKAPAATTTKAPVTTPAAKSNVVEDEAVTGYGKPDQAAYNKEQEELKAQIDALQPKINAVKDQIALTSKNGPGADRRAELRAEMDSIKGQQSGIKGSRSKLFEQIKALQESNSKKVKDLQTAKQKTPFKSVEDIEAHIKNLERQIESGSLKLVDEKKALADISASKRARRTVEGFQAEQESVDADRARIDELRKQLDDPESKAISDRYEAIKTELDEIKAQGDEAYANRNKLFDQRKELSTQLDALWTQKKESSRVYKESGDRYWKKVQDERAKKAERYAAQRQAIEEEKRKEIADRLREEAEAPAFQAQIEDCQTLIDYLAIKAGGGAEVSAPPLNLGGTRAEIAGVPKLETREIDTSANEGLVVRKKKGEDEENYFVGGKGKKKGSAKGPSNAAPTPTSTSDKLNLPLPTLTALLTLSIPPPASTSDIARTIQDLKTKKEWFEANQKRVTEENIAKADAEIKRLENASGSASKGTNTPKTSEQPANANGTKAEVPAEPAPTPAVTDQLSNGVATEAVDEKIEEIKEAEEEA